MKYDEFIKHVQNLSQLSSRAEAENAVRATLETIKERIVGNEASQLAAQLPKEMQQYLHGREGEDGQYFALAEFYRRVGEKAGVDANAVASHVRAVFATLKQAITPGEFADVYANFSEDYAEVFAEEDATNFLKQ